jgi:hypothetical protein
MGQRLEIELEVHQMIAIISDGIIHPDAKLDSVFYFILFFAKSLVWAVLSVTNTHCSAPGR